MLGLCLIVLGSNGGETLQGVMDCAARLRYTMCYLVEALESNLNLLLIIQKQLLLQIAQVTSYTPTRSKKGAS